MLHLTYRSWQVVHHVPGRVRLRLPAMILAGEGKLQTSLEQMIGIRSVRINRAANCITICYHPDIEPTLQTLLVTLEAEHQASVRPTQVSKKRSEKKQAAGEWDGLKLPVLAAGLAVTGRWLPGMRFLATLTLLAAVFPVGKRACESLAVDRKFNIDCLDLLALSLGAWQGKLLTPALVLTLHELGDAIREKTARVTAVQSANLEDAIGHFGLGQRGR